MQAIPCSPFASPWAFSVLSRLTPMEHTIWIPSLAGFQLGVACGSPWQETEGWQERKITLVLCVRSSDVHPPLWLPLGGLHSMALTSIRLQWHSFLPSTLPGISPLCSFSQLSQLCE